jgi:hypothetical protein
MRRGLLLLSVLLLGGVTAALAANPTLPAVTTGAASSISTTAASVAGSVNPGGADSTWQFQYGTSTTYGLTTPNQNITAATTTANVSAGLGALTPNTTYHYRLTATNAAGITRGADRSFKTAAPPAKPGVTTSAATSVTHDSAKLNARVDPNGSPTQFFFEYGTSNALGQATPPADAGNGTAARSVSTVLTGLVADTTYYVRAVATSPAGTVRGATKSLRTANLPLSLTLGAAPDPVIFGGDLKIEGRLAGTNIANRAITLMSNPFPYTRGFRRLGTQRVTDAAGVVRFLVAPFGSATQFRLETSGARSGVVTIAVRPRIRLSVRRIRGGRVRATGLVFPSRAAGRVSIQRRTASGAFVPLRRTQLTSRTSGGARYAATLRVRPGAVLRAVYIGGSGGPLLSARSVVKRAR